PAPRPPPQAGGPVARIHVTPRDQIPGAREREHPAPPGARIDWNAARRLGGARGEARTPPPRFGLTERPRHTRPPGPRGTTRVAPARVPRPAGHRTAPGRSWSAR